jgi:putative peptidoglycan lipid II flippase
VTAAGRGGARGGGDGARGIGTGAVVAGLAGSAALIAAVTVAARLTGFGRTLVFSAAVGGQGCLGTAYATANRLPNVLFEVAAGGALAGAVVPVLAGRLAAGRRADADQAASALLTWTVLLLTPLALLLAAVSGPVTTALLGGAGGGSGTACTWTATDAATMLVLFAPQVVLYGVGIVLVGVLQAHSRFGWPAAAPLLSSVTVIAAYLVFGAIAGGAQDDAAWRPGAGALLVLAGGTTLGVAALSLPLLLPVRRAGIRLRPTLRFPAGAAAQLRVLAFAGLGALLAQQVAVVVTVVLANRVGGTGAYTVVEFAQTVYLLPYAVLAVPVATAAFPRLSAQAAGGDRAGYAATLAATTRVVVLVSLAGTGLLVAVAPAVQALFLGLDAVGGGVLPDLGATLTAFAPGLLGWALVAHLGRALYAAEQGRAAAVATIGGWAAAVAASVAAVLVLDAATDDGGRAAVVGLALGNSVGMTLAGVLLLRAVRRTSDPAALRGTGRALLAATAAAVAAAAAGRPVADLLAGGPGAPASPWAAVGAGIVAAFVASVAFALVAAALDRPTAVALADRLRRTRS